MGFPGGSDGKESACNAGNPSSTPASGRIPREGNGNPLQYSCLENSMDSGTSRLQFMGLQRAGHDWVTNTFTFHTWGMNKLKQCINLASHADIMSSQVGLVVKNPSANAGDIQDMGSFPGSGRSPRGGHGYPLQYFCLENSQGQRSLVGYSPRVYKESDTTEATWHTPLNYCSVSWRFSNVSYKPS